MLLRNILFLSFALIQFFFILPYWNDKTSTVVSLTESGTLIGKNIPCVDLNGKVQLQPLWAEEPPVFHGLAWVLKEIGFGNLYVKLTPFLCVLFWIWGVMTLLKNLEPQVFAKKKTWIFGVLLSLPCFFIHAGRPLPDLLASGLLVFSVGFLWKEQLIPFFILSCLASLTKILVWPALICAALGFVIFKRSNWKWLVLAGVSVLPSLGWFIFLKMNQIPNPFFKTQLEFSRHLGGSDYSVLWTFKYWSRMFNWWVIRGISIPLFFTAGLFLLKKKLRFRSPFDLSLFLWALGLFPYWIAVRGPQYTAPWYSFPFLTPWILFGLLGLLQIRSAKWQTAIVFAILLCSLPKVEWTLKWKDALSFSVQNRPVQLSCENHFP